MSVCRDGRRVKDGSRVKDGRRVRVRGVREQITVRG